MSLIKDYSRKRKIVTFVTIYAVIFGPLLAIMVAIRQVIPGFVFDTFEVVFFPHLLVAYHSKWYFLYLKFWLSLFTSSSLFHDGFKGYFIERYPLWRLLLTGKSG